MYIYSSPLIEELYIFSNDCNYNHRDVPLCIMDAIYTHEGKKVYISGLRGKFNRSIYKIIKKYMEERGVIQVEYEHNKKHYLEKLNAKKTS